MTERLSDERLRRISGNGTSSALPTVSEVPEMARELLELRAKLAAGQDTSSRAVSRYDHADDALYLSHRSNPDD